MALFLIMSWDVTGHSNVNALKRGITQIVTIHLLKNVLQKHWTTFFQKPKTVKQKRDWHLVKPLYFLHNSHLSWTKLSADSTMIWHLNITSLPTHWLTKLLVTESTMGKHMLFMLFRCHLLNKRSTLSFVQLRRL